MVGPVVVPTLCASCNRLTLVHVCVRVQTELRTAVSAQSKREQVLLDEVSRGGLGNTCPYGSHVINLAS